MKLYKKLFFLIIIMCLGLFSLRYIATLAIVYKGKNIAENGSLMLQIYACKDVLAQRLSDKKNRLIVISGSNGLYGINNTILEQETGLPVINMATHAGLPLDYLMARSLKYVKSGDIVVLPLEFAYYGRPKFEEWEMQSLFYWGKSFLRDLPLWQSFEYLIRVPTEVFRKQMKSKTLPTEDEWIKAGQCDFSKQIKFTQIGQEYLQKDGTYLSGDKNIYNKLNGYGLSTTEFRLKQIAEYKRLIESKGAKFFLTYPALLENEAFNLKDENIQRSIKFFEEKLSKFGLILNCSPENSYFERKYFYDTEYHLTNEGAVKRSKNLGKCLRKTFSLTPQRLLEEETIFLNVISGFYANEGFGRWSEGTTSIIRLYFNSENKVKLKFDVFPFLSRQQPKLQTKIFIGKELIATWNFEQGKQFPNTVIDIPKKFIKKDKFIDLEFHYSNNKSPQELELSNDNRILNLGFKSVTIIGSSESE